MQMHLKDIIKNEQVKQISNININLIWMVIWFRVLELRFPDSL